MQRETYPKYFETSKWGKLAVTSKADILGKGTYGTVFRATSVTDPTIQKAIKCLNPDTIEEYEGVPATTIREVNALKILKCPNVMAVEEVIHSNIGACGFAMVMELCRGTLQNKIHSMASEFLFNSRLWSSVQPKRYPGALPAAYVKCAKLVAWQLLNSITACHSGGIMHRDIKPANIMWSNDDLLKLGDFGLARFIRADEVHENSLIQQTGEIQTLYYRAPEVLLGDSNYGFRVDDWSVGCCIAELFHFKFERSKLQSLPLFMSTGEVTTLMLIFDTLSTPTGGYLTKLKYWSPEFPKFLVPRLRETLSLMDDQGYDLVSKILVLDPLKRASCKDLLLHPWFDDVKEEIHKLLLSNFADEDIERKRRISNILSKIEPARRLNKNNTAKRGEEENTMPCNDSGEGLTLSKTKRDRHKIKSSPDRRLDRGKPMTRKPPKKQNVGNRVLYEGSKAISRTLRDYLG